LSIRPQLTLSTVSTGCPHGTKRARPLGRFGQGVEIATWALGSTVAVLSGAAIRVRRRKDLRRQLALGYTTCCCCCCSATCCQGTLDDELQAAVAFMGDDVTGIDSLEPPWPAWSMRSRRPSNGDANSGSPRREARERLEVWGLPNSADVIIDALRCPTIAQARGLGRPASMT
jgi:hypothetical protein